MNVRIFCVLRSRRSCLSWRSIAMGCPSLHVALFLGRPLDDEVPLLQARDDLAVEAVREAGGDLDLLRLGLGRGARDLDERLLAAVLEGDDPLGDEQDVLLFL